jgi:hypothetical protein
MAIIYSYPKNTDILSTDVVVGTSTRIVNGKRKNTTKNFEISSISEYYNETSSIAITGQSNFFFQNYTAPGRKPGSISFISGGGSGTNFSSITTMRISKFATSGNSIIEYIDTFIDQAIIIAQVDNLNNFGIYKFISITQSITEPNFYDIVIEVVNSNGAILEDKFYGFAIYPGFVNPDINPGSDIDLTTVGSTGAATFIDGTLNIPVYSNLPIRRNAQYSNVNYCGYAPFGSLESDAVWTVTKITVAVNGTVTTSVFNNVTWTSVPI